MLRPWTVFFVVSLLLSLTVSVTLENSEEIIFHLENSQRVYDHLTKSNRFDLRSDMVGTGNRTSTQFDPSSEVSLENLILQNSSILIQNSPNAIISNLHLFFSNQVAIGIIIENSPGVQVKNVTIDRIGSSNIPFGGIIIRNSDLTKITNSTVRNFESSYNGSSTGFTYSFGIYITTSSNVLISGNYINNLKNSGVAGILFDNSRNLTLKNNTISKITTPFKNQHEEAAGIVGGYSENLIIEMNTIENIGAKGDLSASSWGITLLNSKKININSNFITSIFSQAFFPEVAGIDFILSEMVTLSTNQIQNMTSISIISAEAYTTGIYYAYSNKITLMNNIIYDLSTFGRATYGIFSDFSSSSLITNNSIQNLYSISNDRATSLGIGMRQSPQSKILRNSLIKFTAILQMQSFTSGDHQSHVIGISLDRSNYTIIANNLINNFLVSSNFDKPTDNIGIINSHSNDVTIKENSISNFNSQYTRDSIANGIIIWRSQNSSVVNNEISTINSFFSSFGVSLINVEGFFMIGNIMNDIFSDNSVFGISITFSDNGIVFDNRFRNFKGLYENIFIHSFRSEEIDFDMNLLQDFNSLKSLAFSIQSSRKLYIKNNNMSYFENWLFRSNSSTRIFCTDNTINGEFHENNCDKPPIEITSTSLSILIVLIILTMIFNPKRKLDFIKNQSNFLLEIIQGQR